MADIKQIQALEESCLQEINRICQENGIPYIIAWGTFLGAVRHKGFIPWDDDLDTCMLYRDLKKIRKGINNHKFFFQCAMTDPKAPFSYTKIRVNHTRMVEAAYNGIIMHQGIWMDIFPLFNSASSPLMKKVQYKLGKALQMLRSRYCYLDKQNSIKKRIISHFPFLFALLMEQSMLFFIQIVGSKKSDEYFSLCDGSFSQSFMNRSFFDERELYDFEGKQYYGPKNGHEYLIWAYGEDYMIPKKWAHIKNYDEVIL